MRVSSLFYYFFSGSVVLDVAGTLDASYAGLVVDGSATVSAGVSADSRGWRYHAHAPVESIDIVAVKASAPNSISAAASVSVVGFDVHAKTGNVSVYTDVTIAAKASVPGISISVIGGTVRAHSDSRVDVASADVRILESTSSASATAVISIRGQQIRTSIGRVQVEIGPDLVQMEEDEFLFLLEVA